MGLITQLLPEVRRYQLLHRINSDLTSDLIKTRLFGHNQRLHTSLQTTIFIMDGTQRDLPNELTNESHSSQNTPNPQQWSFQDVLNVLARGKCNTLAPSELITTAQAFQLIRLASQMMQIGQIAPGEDSFPVNNRVQQFSAHANGLVQPNHPQPFT